MRIRFQAILPAAALFTVGLMSIPSASASTIYVGLQESGVNGGAVTLVDTDLGLGVLSFLGTYGQFTINTITANGAGSVSPLPQGTLDTTSINLSSTSTAAASINVFVTETGLTSPAGMTSFLSSFTAQPFGGNATTSVVESTYYGTSNQLWGGTALASQSFTGAGTSSFVDPANLTGGYSETVEYTITKGLGSTNVNDTINLSTAVTPEPSSLMLLGTGMIGAATTLLRRRKLIA